MSLSILELVQGYRIPFAHPPPLSLPRPSSITRFSNRVVDEELASLLNKGAVEKIPRNSRGYYSRIFCVPKPVRWRPIINLKLLNARYIETPHFRMDTTKDVALLLRPNDWAATIDLKDAYFHVPIDRRSRRFLRFGWRGEFFQFCVLPFGFRPPPIHASHEAPKGISSIERNKDDMVSGRYPRRGSFAEGVRRQRQVGFVSPKTRGFRSEFREVVDDAVSEVSIPRVDMGLNVGNDLDRRGKAAGLRRSGDEDASFSAEVPGTSATPRPHDGGPLGGTAHSSSLSIPATGSLPILSTSRTCISESGVFRGVDSGPSLDEIFGVSPVRGSNVASPSRRMRRGSGDGRVGHGMGHIFPGSPPQGILEGNCRCPSPYKCEGTPHFGYLPPLLSPSFRPSSHLVVEDGQHDVHRICPAGGGNDLPSSSTNCTEAPPPRPRSSSPDPSSVCTIGGKSSRRRGVKISNAPGLGSSGGDFSADLRSVGDAGDRPFRLPGVNASSSVFRVGGRSRRGRIRRSRPKMGFRRRIRVSSSSSPASDSETGGVGGDIHPRDAVLAGTEVVGPSLSLEDSRHRSTSGRTPRHRPIDGYGASSSSPSSRLEDFRRLQGLDISDTAFDLVALSWRHSSSSRYDAAWRAFKDFIIHRGI